MNQETARRPARRVVSVIEAEKGMTMESVQRALAAWRSRAAESLDPELLRELDELLEDLARASRAEGEAQLLLEQRIAEMLSSGAMRLDDLA